MKVIKNAELVCAILRVLIITIKKLEQQYHMANTVVLINSRHGLETIIKSRIVLDNPFTLAGVEPASLAWKANSYGRC